MIMDLLRLFSILVLVFPNMTCQKKEPVVPFQNRIMVELLDGSDSDTVFWMRYNANSISEIFSLNHIFHINTPIQYQVNYGVSGSLISINGNDNSYYNFSKEGNRIIMNSRLGDHWTSPTSTIGPGIDFFLDLNTNNKLEKLEWSFWSFNQPGGPGSYIDYFFDPSMRLRSFSSFSNGEEELHFVSEDSIHYPTSHNFQNPFGRVPPEIYFLITPNVELRGYKILLNCLTKELIWKVSGGVSVEFIYEFDDQGRPTMVEERRPSLTTRHWKITYN